MNEQIWVEEVELKSKQNPGGGADPEKISRVEQKEYHALHAENAFRAM